MVVTNHFYVLFAFNSHTWIRFFLSLSLRLELADGTHMLPVVMVTLTLNLALRITLS